MRYIVFLSLWFAYPWIAQGSSQIIFVRHGEGEHNVIETFSSWTREEGGTDHSLTLKGQSQVAQTAFDLLQNGITKDTVGLVLVSPLLRTRQTAQILVDMGVCSPEVIQVEERIREQVHGELEGFTLSKIRLLFPQMNGWEDEVAASAASGGESRASLHKRLAAVLDELAALDLEKKAVILVMHGYPIATLLDLLGFPGQQPKTGEALCLPAFY